MRQRVKKVARVSLESVCIFNLKIGSSPKDVLDFA